MFLPTCQKAARFLARSYYSGGNVSYPLLKTKNRKKSSISLQDYGFVHEGQSSNGLKDSIIESSSDISSLNSSVLRKNGSLSLTGGSQQQQSCYLLSEPKYRAKKVPVGLLQRKTSIDEVIKQAARSPGVGDYDYGKSFQLNSASGSSRYRPKTSSQINVSSSQSAQSHTSNRTTATPSSTSTSSRWKATEVSLQEASLTPGPGTYHSRMSREGTKEGGRPTSVHMSVNTRGMKSQIEQVIERESQLPSPVDYQSHDFYYENIKKASSIHSPVNGNMFESSLALDFDEHNGNSSSHSSGSHFKPRRNKKGLLMDESFDHAAAPTSSNSPLRRKRSPGFSISHRTPSDLDQQLMRSKHLPGPADYSLKESPHARGGWVDKSKHSYMTALLQHAKEIPGPGQYRLVTEIESGDPLSYQDGEVRSRGSGDSPLRSPLRSPLHRGLPGGKFNMSNPKSEIDLLISTAASTPGAGEYNPKSPSKYDSNYKDRVPSYPSKLQYHDRDTHHGTAIRI